MGAGLALAAACTDQTNEGFPPADGDGGTSTRRDGGGSGDDDGGNGGGEKDGAVAEKDAGCTYVPAPPVADGGGQCGTIEFGRNAVVFGGVDAGDTGFNRGGVIPPGIYDTALAERGSGSGGSMRETVVILPNGRFTRVRQLDSGSGNGVGPVTRRSGSYAYTDAGVVTFTYDCATSNGTDAGAPGADSLPYEYVELACGKGVYRYGLTSLRFTLERR